MAIDHKLSQIFMSECMFIRSRAVWQPEYYGHGLINSRRKKKLKETKI